MAQLIDLGKLRFHFAGAWSSSTTYERNDIVKYGGNVYVYTYALKTSGNLPTDTAYWALMIEGFNFVGVFDTATNYKVGDGITHGGVVYISIKDSINVTPPNAEYWSQFVDGVQYDGEYSNTANYQKNDMVTYGGSVYIAKQDTTGNLPTVTSYWDQLVEGVSPEGIYNAATAYVPGDIVAYGPNLYRAIDNTTGNIPTNETYWEVFVTGTKFVGTYNSATTYYLNDIVVYGNNLYRARNEVSNTLPTVTSDWELVVSGNSFKGDYGNTTQYYVGDIVNYGANSYIALNDTLGNLPTDGVNWDLYVSGFSYQGVWSDATEYFIGQVVTYGGSLYKALADSLAANPATDSASWSKINGGYNNKGDWTTATAYAADDVVVYGGNTYIALVPHASSTFSTDLAANKWQKFTSGVRYRGEWSSAAIYLVDDIVKDGISSYIATEDHTASGTFAADFDAGKWEFFARGATDVLPTVGAGDIGKSLTIAPDGINYEWISATGSNQVFYVAPHGTDTPGAGTSIATPFASIKYATQNCGTNAVINVLNGTYTEQLPIVVPDTVSIIGDSQRNCIVQPAAGLSDDGVTPNNEADMFRLSNGSILRNLTLKGMTGWVPADAPNQDSVAASTPKGIGICLNPDSPVTTKSPYVMDCTAIGTGMVGAYVNGNAHATGNTSMLFHAYTVISDNGVGFWIANGAKAEIVSCFTYYCYFGYAADHGAQIRALNGNNSYGEWGAISEGFDQSEVPLTGAISGRRIQVLNIAGNINAGDTLTGGTSGATATVTNVQATAGYIYIKDITGTFQAGENITATSGGSADVDQDVVEDQRGFVIVVDGLSEEPKPGRSIQFSDDSVSYVIQSVTGTYVDATSDIVIVLSQEKPTGSADNADVTIRQGFSQIRLTGHDFLNIGTGGVATTNYPGEPTQPPSQGNEIQEVFPARVYYVSTDQDGNFRVGEYFKIEQATGKATLNASAFDLAGLTSLRLGSIGAQLGETINEFSSDGTMSGNSNLAVPTEYAVKTYVDTYVTEVTSSLDTIPFAPNTISSDQTLSNGMRFSIGSVTVPEGVTYTIGTNGYHYVIEPGATFALFQ